MSVEGENGPGPEDIGSAGAEAGRQWEADSARAEADFEKGTEQDPADRDQLINETDPDRLIEEQLERERFLLDAVGKTHEASLAELAERYKLNDGNVLSRFIKKVSARFAGEFRDIEIAKEVAENAPDEREEALKKSFQFFSKENARRVAKNITKTAVTGGIGAGITAILGGAVASPAFGLALLGGFAARGAVELIRHTDPEEREARFKAIEARADVFACAARLQQEAGELLGERENASRERKAEIDAEIENMHIRLVAELKYKSEEAIYSDGTEAQKATIRGMEKVFELGKEKNTLERKREKIADLIAAGGSLMVGIAGSFVTETFTHTTEEAAQGFVENLDGKDLAHFVRHITPDQVVSTTNPEAFAQQLKESGGYVFQYNPGEYAKAAEGAAKYGYELTTATLNNGEVVHVLNGMTDSRFAELLAQHSSVSKEVITQTSFNVAKFFKEAVPLAAANTAFFVRNLYAGRAEPPAEPVQERSVTDQAWKQWERGVAEGRQAGAGPEEPAKPEVKPDIPGTGPKYDEEVRVPINSSEPGLRNEETRPVEEEVSGVYFNQYDYLFNSLRDPQLQGSWEGVEATALKGESGIETRQITFKDEEGITYIYKHEINSRRDALKKDRFILDVYNKDNKLTNTYTELNTRQVRLLLERIDKKRRQQQ